MLRALTRARPGACTWLARYVSWEDDMDAVLGVAKESERVFLFMEWCQGGTLKGAIHKRRVGASTSLFAPPPHTTHHTPHTTHT